MQTQTDTDINTHLWHRNMTDLAAWISAHNVQNMSAIDIWNRWVTDTAPVTAGPIAAWAIRSGGYIDGLKHIAPEQIAGAIGAQRRKENTHE